jgi:DNA polymerase-4
MRKIIHVDMDCFYAAVEVKKNPKLAGLPLGIGGPPNTRSVLCTASYEARKFGVKAAMPSSQAVRLCPDLILIPPDFDAYKRESRAVREIFERFTPQIEPLSLDEAYLDVSDSPYFNGSATLIAQEIRRMIFDELNLTASAGIAPNKFIAKIASDWKKPNGQFVVRPEEVSAFVEKLPVEKIYGVGKVTAQKMHSHGLFTCADIQKRALSELTHLFGSRGPELYNFARGIDERQVHNSEERKSLSVEQTFNRDIATLSDCLREVPGLFEDWLRRMEKNGLQDRLKSIQVKLKFHDFKATTCDETIRHFPTIEDFSRLLERAWSRRGEPVRLIGLGAHLQQQNPETEQKPQAAVNQLQFGF